MFHLHSSDPDLLVRPNKPEVFQLDGGGVLLVWKPIQSSDSVTYCVEYCTDGGCKCPVSASLDWRGARPESLCRSSSGGDWTLLSEEVTDSCCVAKDLPRGASYVFRVGCITKTGTGPFSDASTPVVMATHPEGEKEVSPLPCLTPKRNPKLLFSISRDSHSSHPDRVPGVKGHRVRSTDMPEELQFPF